MQSTSLCQVHMSTTPPILRRGRLLGAPAGKLLAQGWDAFWLDSAEPEEYWPHMGDAILSSRQLTIGNGAEFTNVFPLVHTLGVQDHWKAQNRASASSCSRARPFSASSA